MALAAMIMAGCAGREKNREVDRDLNAAESLMESQPDSALRMLQRIDTPATLSGERRARHALLLSQAYDKNSIDLTDDSLISIAVDFYERTDNARYKMLSYHYLGSIYLNAGQYGPALHAALNAHDQAVGLADTLNLSRIESMLGRIYFMAYDYKEALRWDLMSLENAKQINHTDWIQGSYHDIAGEYMSMGQYDSALIYADSAIALTGTPTPRALDIQFRSYFGKHMDSKADSILSIMIQSGISLTAEIGEVINFFDERSAQEDLEHKNQIIHEQNEYIKEILNQTLSASHNQYLNDKSRRMNEEIERKKTQLEVAMVVGALVVALLVLLLILLRQRSQRRQAEIELALEALRADFCRVKSELEQENSKSTALNNGIGQPEQQQMEHARSYGALRRDAALTFVQRFSWVDELGNILLDADLVATNREQRLYKAVKDMLKEITPQSYAAEIEKSCQERYPSLLDEIKDLNLSCFERQILMFMIGQVSNRVICMLSGKSNASVYSTKARIRTKLRNANTPLAEHLLTII